MDTAATTVAEPTGDLVVGAATAAVGCLVGGVVFGLQMQSDGVIPMVTASRW